MTRFLGLAALALFATVPVAASIAGESFTVFDLAYKGSKGRSMHGHKPGTVSVWHDPLALLDKGVSVGISTGICADTTSTGEEYCSWTLTLETGTLVTHAIDNIKDGSGDYIVLGGSGAYTGATGTVHWSTLQHPLRYKVDITLN